MNIALLVVVPIFLTCYGGSCIAYMIYKVYRNCYGRHAKAHTLNLESMEPPAAAAFPTYLPNPAQALPAPMVPETLRGGRSSLNKAPARYETQLDNENVPISDILMKKITSKSSTTAY